MVIPANIRHLTLEPTGIGLAACCKINANIGNSAIDSNIEGELEKLRRSVKLGAHTVMDLSTGGDIDAIREAIIHASPVPIGTVPIYQALEWVGKMEALRPRCWSATSSTRPSRAWTITVHAGILREHLPLIRKRLTGVVSRGGAILAHWMAFHHKQNPLYEAYDDILAIAREYDVTLSLGDGLRRSIRDASVRPSSRNSGPGRVDRTPGPRTCRSWSKAPATFR